MAKVLLLGHPVAHSLSPAMHNAAFAALGLPHRYETRDVQPDALADAVAALRRDDTVGANVTIPHKEAATRLVDELADEARAIGAVNTIVRRGSRLIGHNTDLYGFETAAAAQRALPSNDRALVLGAGGAARACVYSLLNGNEVFVANRTQGRAERLSREVQYEGKRATVIAWPRTDADIDDRRIDVLVNATSLGLRGEDPIAGLRIPSVLIDIVPTREETPLVKRAREAQYVNIVDGLSMLLHQAARSFELWTGAAAPIEAMRAALPRPA